MGKSLAADSDDLVLDMCTPLKQSCFQEGASSSTSAVHIKKGKLKKEAMVETEVRHNVRIQKQSKGFKRSACGDRNCFACSIEPPVLSYKIIKNLGESFCKMAPSVLLEEALPKKKVKSAVGEGKERVKKMRTRPTSARNLPMKMKHSRNPSSIVWRHCTGLLLESFS